MKYFIATLFIISSLSINALDVLGEDSGHNPIFIYNNGQLTDDVLLIIGGIHGDESYTSQVVDHIRLNSNYPITTYFIPSINPTIYAIKEKIKGVEVIKGRRGYLKEHLDSEGYVIKKSPLENFDKKLFYRIFYGNDKTYKNGINRYVDPNRDFLEMYLPSTRLLVELIDRLKAEHKNVTILSFHGYMDKGRVYPEYRVEKGEILINNRAWEMAKAFAKTSSYIPETMYTPAKAIIERFEGELISYTGKIEGVTALDIELDSNNHIDNYKNSLVGVNSLVDFLLNEQ
ncbi:MAG: hypothetical protein OCD02_12155 [Spirochaetaceae bacterium]